MREEGRVGGILGGSLMTHFLASVERLTLALLAHAVFVDWRGVN